MPKKRNEEKIDRLSGVGCLLINIFFWPGLGTLIAGKIRSGVIQMVMFLMGILVSYTSISSICWSSTGPVIAYGSITLLIIAWTWGLISGILIIKIGYNPRIKNKFLIRNYVKIAVIAGIFLLSVGIYFYTSSKSQDVTKLSIPDISQSLLDPNFINENGINKINLVLNQRFEQLKCSEAETINMTYVPPLFNVCNFENFWHYVEVKIRLGMKHELLKNEELISLLNRTYNQYKPFYASKDKLSPYDNRWNHIMNAVISLDLLNKEEKDFWVLHYASLKYDENQPKFPQAWNRIWMFRYLDIASVYTLASKYNLSLSQVQENVCSYIPSLDDAYNQNLFSESKKTMTVKYLSIRHFCDIPFTEEDYKEAHDLGFYYYGK